MKNQTKKYNEWINKNRADREERFKNWDFVGSGYFRSYTKQEFQCKKCKNITNRIPQRFCGRCRNCEAVERENTKQLIFDMLKSNGRRGILTKIDVNWSIRSGKTIVNYNRDLLGLSKSEIVKLLTVIYDLNPEISVQYDNTLSLEDFKNTNEDFLTSLAVI